MELLVGGKRRGLTLGVLAGLAMLAAGWGPGACVWSAEPAGGAAPAPQPAPSRQTGTAPGPALELEIIGPQQATVGGKAVFVLVVTNAGKTTARNLLVIDRFDPGLEHAVAASPIEHDVPDLEPGKAHRLAVSFQVTRSGVLSHTVELCAGGQTAVTATATLRAASAGERKKAAPDAKTQPDAKAEPKPVPGSAFPDIPFKEPSKEEEQEKPPDLGPPLVDHPEDLKRLHPEYPIWVDRKNRRVVFLGGVCLRQSPLELFACLRSSKEHESVLSVPVKASFVHAGLLAVGAEPGAPAVFQPTYVPAHGTEIEVTVAWKDAKGQRQTARAQDWVRDVKTQKAMAYPWVFAGSRIITNAVTGEVAYQADREGDFICVSNFPAAVLDLPIPSSSNNEELLFEAFTEHIPPKGTPVTVILTPKPAKPDKPPTKPDAPAKAPAPSKADQPKPAPTQAKPEVKPEVKPPVEEKRKT
jgi:uncharacterized repeat protein (TIGR01451 family)